MCSLLIYWERIIRVVHSDGAPKYNGPLSTGLCVAVLVDVNDDSGDHQVNGRWSDALAKQGLNVAYISPSLTDCNELASLLGSVDGIFLPGGNTNIHPDCYGREPLSPSVIFGQGQVPKHQFAHDRDRMSKILVDYAIANDMPLFGVCRGMQELNVALGGTMQQKVDDHDQGYRSGDWQALVHSVEILDGTPYRKLFQEVSMMQSSIHRQGMYVEDIASGLEVFGMADDGRVVEGVYHPDKEFIVGVQYHAELQDRQPLNTVLFGAYRDAVSTYAASSRTGLAREILSGGAQPAPAFVAE